MAGSGDSNVYFIDRDYISPPTTKGSNGGDDDDNDDEILSNSGIIVLVVIFIIAGAFGTIGILYWKKPEEFKTVIEKIKQKFKKDR